MTPKHYAIPLESRCRGDMLEGDRRRGQAYFHQGRVDLLRLFPTSVLAVVEGGARYFVAVEGDEAKHGCLKVLTVSGRGV